MKLSKNALLICIVLLICLLLLVNGQHDLTLAALKAKQHSLEAYFHSNPLSAVGLYMLIYISATALSLPGAAVLTLAGGALFGLGWGLVIVSIASTIGATAAFFAARFLFKDFVEQKFSQQLDNINIGLSENGIFYLLSLRLVPIVPFVLINVLMGLTRMSGKTFFWVSQLGMLPGTAVYVNAGTQLGKISTLSDVLSPQLWLSFVLLGIFPLFAPKISAAIKSIGNHK